MADARVVGRFLAVVADTIADADESPDHVPLRGTITLTASASAVLQQGADPTTFLTAPIVATLDSQGYVSLNGTRGVAVLAPNVGLNPSSWTYKVTPALTLDGKLVPYGSWDISVAAGETVDLAVAAPVPTSTGTYMTRGIGVQSAASVNGALVLTLTDGSTTAPVPLPPGPQGPQGDGVRAVDTLPASTPPNAFPTGITVFSADSGGYPAQYATVETVRYGGHRSWQTVVERTTGRSWRRCPDAGDATWLPWIEWGVSNLKVGTTTTGEPGTNAFVAFTGYPTEQLLHLTIPRGNTGAQGPKGDTGALGVHIGTTPPTDTTRFWIDTSA